MGKELHRCAKRCAMPGLPLPTRDLDKIRAVLGHIRFFLALPPKQVGKLFADTYNAWSNDNAPRLGAALAYYTVFSLAPLLVVVIAVAGLVFGPAAARGQVVWQIQDLIGRDGAEAVQTMLKAAWAPAQGLIATVLSLLALFLGASLVVMELRNSLNVVWHVPAQNSQAGFIASLIDLFRERLYAFSLVLGVGFLLLVSLVANAMLSALGRYFRGWLPTPEVVLQAANFVIWLVMTTFIFALIYKVLPDVKIAWSDVIVGAAMTSLLFTLGKLAIALYIGKSSLASAYGAAGSLVVLLAWVYYSAQVFFFGAEFTQVYADTFGSRFIARRRWQLKMLRRRAHANTPAGEGVLPQPHTT
jgi:membrane protein